MTALTMEALLAKYNKPVPRYTSYPTAPFFSPEIGADHAKTWLGELTADDEVSLYAHVPFCRKLCYFCGCHMKVVNGDKALVDYAQTLRHEIEQTAHLIGRRQKAMHLNWGGGTPSILPTADFTMLMETLKRCFDFQDGAELAIELDPRVITEASVQAFAATGLNRASIGVQDFNPQVQTAINRVQPYEVTKNAVTWLRNAGIQGVNFDLIYGLPEQSLETIRYSVDRAVSLQPSRLALFGYAHVPWMKAHQKILEHYHLPAAEERQEMFELAAELLEKAGYVKIGYDHFALPDDDMALAYTNKTLHRNFQGFTTDTSEYLLNFGASAIGTLPGGYVQNHPQVQDWRAAVESGILATAKGVPTTVEDRLRRRVIERLMCDYAVDTHAVCAQLNLPHALLEDVWAKVALLAADGLASVENGVVTVTECGRPFVRVVASCFDAYFAPKEQQHAQAV